MESLIKILLVDDSDADVRRFDLMLNDPEVSQGLEFVVEHAGTVPDAISMINIATECNRPYDVILQDLVIPPYAGEEIVKIICAAAPDSAVLCLTGVDNPELRRAVYDAGAVGYTVKAKLIDPFVDMSQALRDSILNALETKRQANSEKGNEATPE